MFPDGLPSTVFALVAICCTVTAGSAASFWSGSRRVGYGFHGGSGGGGKNIVAYQTYYFDQRIDHFNFVNDDTYKMRYLVAKQYWDNNGGPIFFYAGNEGDIALFCNNTGFMWDIAAEFGAMLVFAEHRYYGKSLPFGQDSFRDREHMGFLTTEQALADYAVLIGYMKASIPGASSSPVIAFGGSYGGMLAAWLRMKYPQVVVGSIAASAPIWQLSNLTNCNSEFSILSKVFKDTNSLCSQGIRASWAVIDDLGSTDKGRKQLQTALGLCNTLDTLDDVTAVKSWLQNTWFNLAMVNYPYPANFLAPLPGFPVKAACSHFKTPNPTSPVLLDELSQALNVYYNYTHSASCFNISQDATGALSDTVWDFQFCTEMVMPTCADGIHDMFEPSPWDYAKLVEHCQASWGVKPRPRWPLLQFWGKNISTASNIVFSNGLLDPWSGGGVLKSISDTLVAVIIPEGAHHLDLRFKNKADPASVVAARNTEKAHIKKWIAASRTS